MREQVKARADQVKIPADQVKQASPHLLMKHLLIIHLLMDLSRVGLSPHLGLWITPPR